MISILISLTIASVLLYALFGSAKSNKNKLRTFFFQICDQLLKFNSSLDILYVFYSIFIHFHLIFDRNVCSIYKIFSELYDNSRQLKGWSYQRLKSILKGKKLPSMIVDLEKFDRNVQKVKQIAEKHNKVIR